MQEVDINDTRLIECDTCCSTTPINNSVIETDKQYICIHCFNNDDTQTLLKTGRRKYIMITGLHVIYYIVKYLVLYFLEILDIIKFWTNSVNNLWVPATYFLIFILQIVMIYSEIKKFWSRDSDIKRYISILGIPIISYYHGENERGETKLNIENIVFQFRKIFNNNTSYFVDCITTYLFIIITIQYSLIENIFENKIYKWEINYFLPIGIFFSIILYIICFAIYTLYNKCRS